MKTKFNNLKEVNKGNPFKVPDNYFAQFNEGIMNHLPEKEKPEKEWVPPRQVSLWEKAKPWVYLAAMLVGLYVTVNFLTRSHNENLTANQEVTAPITVDRPTDSYWSTVQITEEEFYQYLEEQLVDVGYYDYLYHQLYLN